MLFKYYNKIMVLIGTSTHFNSISYFYRNRMFMKLTEHVKKEVEKNLSKVIEMRRHLHENPELSFKEYETSKFIQQTLDLWGISYTTGYVETGIVAKISSGSSEKRFALRADMDALPIQEENELGYTSNKPGVMHACGHDAHTASVLGTLKILNENKDLWSGEVTAVFQPGEEQLPGGAKLMLEAGALKHNPDYILGQHVYPDLESGKVGFKSGQYMASCDEIHLEITGNGGHGALPHQSDDVILMASHLLIALQQIVSRKISPYTPCVLSFGYIFANGETNILPNSVKLKGTFRCMDEYWREVAHKEITKITNGVVEGFNGKAHLDIRKGYPSLINDSEITEFSKNRAIEFLGKENVVDLDLRMTAEDFAYYSQMMPACFYRFGTAQKGKVSDKKLHHPKFDIDEEKALRTAVGVMAYTTLSYLKK